MFRTARRTVALAAAAATFGAAAVTAVGVAQPAGAEPFHPVDSCDELEEESIAWWNCHDFLWYGWWWWDDAEATIDPGTVMAAQPEDEPAGQAEVVVPSERQRNGSTASR